MAPILETRNITKTFPGVIANENISFALQEGEVLAFLGENGAGKSTLMNVLYGLYTPDAGEVFVRGERVTIREPRHAIDLGIGMVHQHFQLIPTLTVAENVMLGAEVVRQGLLDHRHIAQEIRALSRQYNLAVDPESLVGDLPVGVQQRVEIIKTLYRRADILILDEPTAVLTPQEIDGLFEIIRSLVQEGKSVIFISHKLKEVLTIADRIIVLREGRVAGETRPAETDQLQLAAMMVGREVILTVDKAPAKPQGVVLAVENLHALDDRRHTALNGVSFEVRAGEILGVAGVQGNGQTELVEVLTGLRHATEGQVTILGTDATNASPRFITGLGTAHVPEDRHKDGLVLSAPVCDNLILCSYHQPPFARGVAMQEKAIVENAAARVSEFDVRTPSVFLPAESLSGGNQQKVIVARELSRPIRLLIAAQPTRGLDVGSIEFIHRRLVEKRDEGAAVLLVSAELDEVLALSDRIVVMYEGRIVATLPIEQADRARLGLLMAGVSET
ncbi:MAG: ABC transporter ATP-binding protein [Chloroflexota bacterium]